MIAPVAAPGKGPLALKKAAEKPSEMELV